MLTESFLIATYITLIVRPPFPAIIIAFFLADFGMLVNSALNNVFCANLTAKATALALLHGPYGVCPNDAPYKAQRLAIVASNPCYMYANYETATC